MGKYVMSQNTSKLHPLTAEDDIHTDLWDMVDML